jgi:pimeloyl-ACP methyl ester carboxylesterase
MALLGHSMGSAVIWCYIDIFGPERLSQIILVDQSPFLTADPHWTQQELEDAGAFLTAQEGLCQALITRFIGRYARGYRLTGDSVHHVDHCGLGSTCTKQTASSTS